MYRNDAELLCGLRTEARCKYPRYLSVEGTSASRIASRRAQSAGPPTARFAGQHTLPSLCLCGWLPSSCLQRKPERQSYSHKVVCHHTHIYVAATHQRELLRFLLHKYPQYKSSIRQHLCQAFYTRQLDSVLCPASEAWLYIAEFCPVGRASKQRAAWNITIEAVKDI